MPRFDAMAFLSALEADAGINVSPVPYTQDTNGAAVPPPIEDMAISDEMNNTTFLMMLRQALGDTTFSEVISGGATDMEVYGLISNAETSRLANKTFCDSRVSAGNDCVIMAMAADMAIAAGDPLGKEYEEIEASEAKVLDAIRAKFYGAAVTKVNEMLDNSARKAIGMDSKNGEIIRSAIEKMRGSMPSPATEGMITNFKLRKVNRSDKNGDVTQTASSIKALCNIEPTDNAPDRPEWKAFSVKARVANIMVHLKSNGGKPTPEQVKMIERAFSNIGKVTNDLCAYIANGADKPSESKEDGSKYSMQEIRSKLSIETFAVRINADDSAVEITLWYDDGGLWGGHACVLSKAFDSNGNYTKDVTFEIAG